MKPETKESLRQLVLYLLAVPYCLLIYPIVELVQGRP
jgi:hypothetical protein